MSEQAYRQSLGRVVRVNQAVLIIPTTQSIEAEICSRLQSKMEIVMLGKITEGIGFPILPKPEITHEYDFDI